MRPVHVLRLLVVLLLLAGAAGCASNNKGKLEGTRWTSDPGKVRGQSVPEGFMKLEFMVNGDLTLRGGGRTFTGTYSFGPGDLVTMYLDKELAGSKVYFERISLDGNRMKMSDPDGTELAFQKR
jgi:hypothetical protein